MDELAKLKEMRPETMQILNGHLGGALRIMKHLGHRGITARSTVSSNNSDVIFASPLLKWVPPSNNQTTSETIDDHVDNDSEGHAHMICIAPELTDGEYYVVFDRYVMRCGPVFHEALEIFVKTLLLLGVKVPKLLRQFVDFICLHVFGTINNSKFTSVTTLSTRLNEGLSQSGGAED